MIIAQISAQNYPYLDVLDNGNIKVIVTNLSSIDLDPIITAIGDTNEALTTVNASLDTISSDISTSNSSLGSIDTYTQSIYTLLNTLGAPGVSVSGESYLSPIDFMVGQNTGTAHFVDYSNTRQIIGTFESSRILWAGSSATIGNSTTNVELIYALFNGANSQAAINNMTPVTLNPGTNGLYGSMYLGYYRVGSPSIIGGIQEFIIYPSNKSVDATTIKTNQNSYFQAF